MRVQSSGDPAVRARAAPVARCSHAKLAGSDPAGFEVEGLVEGLGFSLGFGV